MATPKSELASVQKEREDAAKRLRDLEAQERKIQEQLATEAFEDLVALLKQHLPGMNTVQRGRIRAIVATVGVPRDARKATAKGGTTGKVAPKFQLPDGTTWAGRGNRPNAFVKWARSAEGKAWRQANPGQKWPAAPGAKATTTARRPVVKRAAKKAGTKKAPARKRAAKKANLGKRRKAGAKKAR